MKKARLGFKLNLNQGMAIRVARDTLGQIVNPLVLPAWMREIRQRDILKADVIAGLTVALILIPQSMAYAQLAGLPAHYGLYASLVPPFIAAFFGSSRQLATGPVAMVSLMTAAALEPLAAAGSEAFIGYALLLSLMVGLFQLAMGMFRLGVLLNFLSHPVVLGFVNAAAIIIATSQLDKIFGVTAEAGEHHHEFVFNTIRAALDNTHWPTFAMAVLAFSIMVGVRRFYPRLPYVLIAVVVTTLSAWLMGFAEHRTVPLNQIFNQNIRISLMRDGLQTQLIATQEKKFIEAQRNFTAVLSGAEEETAELLALRQQLEQSRFLLVQLKEQAEAQHKTLYSESLYAIGRGEQTKFLTRAEVQRLEGEESKLFGQDWHIVKYANNQVELQAGGKVIGHVPRGLPGPRLPAFDLAAFKHLVGAAIVISIIGFMEAISIARAIAAKTRQSLNTDRELIGQGMANIAGSLFQAYPSSGSFSRSAVNYNAGAITGFSSLVTVMAVALALLLLTPLLYYLPQATLAAVIMLAVAGLVNVKPLLHAWRTNRHDGIVAMVTFLFTLALAPDLEMGILIGMLLSLVLLLFRIMKPRVVYPPHPSHLLPEEAVAAGAHIDGRIIRMRFDGSLVFVNVAFFEDQLHNLLATAKNLKVLIIDGSSINDVDASGEEMLRENYKRLVEAGVQVVFTRIKSPIMETFKRTHLFGDIDKQYFHRQPVDAFHCAWELVKAHEAAEASSATEDSEPASEPAAS
jgi:MFS superfamily sulfate permease-like transporter